MEKYNYRQKQMERRHFILDVLYTSLVLLVALLDVFVLYFSNTKEYALPIGAAIVLGITLVFAILAIFILLMIFAKKKKSMNHSVVEYALKISGLSYLVGGLTLVFIGFSDGLGARFSTRSAGIAALLIFGLICIMYCHFVTIKVTNLVKEYQLG